MGRDSILAAFFDGDAGGESADELSDWLSQSQSNVRSLAVHGAIHSRLKQLLMEKESPPNDIDIVVVDQARARAKR